MDTFTSEQTLPYTLRATDGSPSRRPVAFEGTPVVAVSDETVVAVQNLRQEGDGWAFDLWSVAEGEARITVTGMTAEAEPRELLGVADVTVTLDPRTAERIIELTAGTPFDDVV